MPYRTLAEQLQEVRRRFNEPSAAAISDNHIISLLNHGAYVSVRDLGVYFEDVYSFSSVADQQDYALPDQFISSSNLLWSPWVNHQPLKEVSISDITNPFPNQGTDPEVYAVDIARRKFMVAPIVTGSAKTTTLNGALNAIATTIPVVSTVGFGEMGRITIDSEVIYYTGTTATSFTGCSRGVNQSTATTHLTSATVTWCDFQLDYQRGILPLKTSYTTGTISITNGTTSVTGVATNWLAGQNVYTGCYLGVGSYELTSSAATFPMKWYKITAIGSVTGITLDTPFLEPTVSASKYIITDKTELMDAESELPILFAEIELYHKQGNVEKKGLAREAYAYEMLQAQKRLNPPDYLPVVKKTREASSAAYPTPRMPGNYPSNESEI